MAGMESKTTSLTHANGSTVSRSTHALDSDAAVQAQTPESARTFFDISKANTFEADSDTPPFPVLAALGSGRLHQFRLEGLWDLDRAIEENGNALIRSYRN